MTPDCYTCQHRGEIPGDAHTRCCHPLVGGWDRNPIAVMVETMQGKYVEAARALNIQGNPVGIRKGWFAWPANFDPVWLDRCDGYTAKIPKVPA